MGQSDGDDAVVIQQDGIAFHEFMALPDEDRGEATPFIYTLDDDQRLHKLAVSPEIVTLAEDRLEVWSLMRQMVRMRL